MSPFRHTGNAVLKPLSLSMGRGGDLVLLSSGLIPAEIDDRVMVLSRRRGKR